TNGSPAGGVYSGTGVSNGQFDPSVGAGTYTVTYSYTNSHGCSATSQTSITVAPAPSVTLTGLPADVCSNASAFELTGGLPAGGTYTGTAISSGWFDPATAGIGSTDVYYSYTDTLGCS